MFVGAITDIEAGVSKETIWPTAKGEVPTVFTTARYPSLLLVLLVASAPKNFSVEPPLDIVAVPPVNDTPSNTRLQL